MDYVNPKALVQETVTLAKTKSQLTIGSMMIRGILAGAFLGFATSLAFIMKLARPASYCGSDSLSRGIRHARLAGL